MGAPNWFSGYGFMSAHANFSPHFLKIVVEMKASGPSHVLGQWLLVSNGMLAVQYFCSNKASFCVS